VRTRTTPWGVELTCEQCGRKEIINPDKGEKETNEDLSNRKQSWCSACPRRTQGASFVFCCIAGINGAGSITGRLGKTPRRR